MSIRTRWLFPLLLVMGLSACVVWKWTDLEGWLQQQSTSYPHVVTEAATTSTIVYRVTSVDWTTFALPPNPDSVRIVSNGCVHPKIVAQSPDQEWSYQLAYRVLSGDTTIDEGTYSFRANAPKGAIGAENKGSSRQGDVFVHRMFFQESDHIPCVGRQMILGFDNQHLVPTKLQLKLTQTDDAIEYGVVRCLCDNIVPEQKLQQRWTRLSPADRERLTEGTVYPLPLLSDVEKQNLVRHQWLQLAPIGIEGENYVRRRMFRYTDFSPMASPSQYNDTMLQRTQIALKLPSAQGTVRLTVDGQNRIASETTDPQKLSVVQQPADLSQIQTRTFLTDGRSETFEIQTKGGLLKVESDARLQVDAQWTSSDGGVPIPLSSAESRFRAYLSHDTDPIRYAVVRNGAVTAPIRLSLRRVLPEEYLAEAVVCWRTLNTEHCIVAQGEIPLCDERSSRSSLRYGAESSGLSEPVRAYIPLRDDATTLELFSDVAVAVSAVTRPDQLETVRPVCSDHEMSIEDESRSWFLLRPINAIDLALQERVATVVVYPEIGQVLNEEQEQDYVWKSFQPQGLWAARHLLVPEPSLDTFRSQGAAIAYFRIDPNSVTDVQFLTDHAELCFWQNSKIGNSVSVKIDGCEVLRDQLLVSSGRLQIPIVSKTGEPCSVEVSTSDFVQLAVNGVQPLGQHWWRRRLATRFENDQLEFNYHKQHTESQTLSLKLYRQVGSPADSQLRVRLMGVVDHSGKQAETLDELRRPSGDAVHLNDWTIPQTRFVIQQVMTQDVVCLLNEEESLEQCGTCFVRLGEDLPPGTYRIQVACVGGNAKYLTCTTLETAPETSLESRRVQIIDDQQHPDDAQL